jgi:hypothetical protein
MFRICLLVCCLRISVHAEEALPFDNTDENTNFQSEDSENFDDEPFDHSAFLQIDDTPDLHIPQTKRARAKLR